MNCAGFEQGLARLMVGEATGGEREQLLSRLREHSAACVGCRGSGDLVDLLASPAGERDIVVDPGEAYWSSFEARLNPRLEDASARSRGRWWVVAASVLLLGLLAGWMLRGPGEPVTPSVVAEFPPSLVRSLDQASSAEVEDQLSALEELEAVWGGGLFPEVERLDAETRERLLDWLRDQNRRLEGAQG